MYVICIDIDNVLNNLTEQAINMYNAENNKNIQMEDITEYDFKKCLPEDDANGLISLFKRKDLWESLSPIDDAKWGVETLIKTGRKVVFATATSPENFEWKIQWIQKYFPIVNPDDVIRIMDKSLIRCDIIVDDCMEQLTSNLCNRICLDYPYNRDDIKDDVYEIKRVKNWKEIVKTIEKIERSEEKWK